MIVYINIIISIMTVYTLIINFSPVQLKFKEHIMMFSSMVICSFMMNEIGRFWPAVPIIIIPIIFLRNKGTNKVLSIIIPTISLIMAMLIDMAVGITIMWLFKFNLNMLWNHEMIQLYGVILEFILVLILSRFLRTFLRRRIKGINHKFKGKMGILAVLIILLTLVIMYANAIVETQYGTNNELVKINGILFLAYFILLMIIMHVLIKNITKEIEYKNKQMQLENLQQYADNLEKMYTEMREFRHDYLNVLSSFAGYIDNEDMDGLKKHFNDKILPFSNGIQSKDFKISLLKNIKIPELKGIVSSKIIRAQELNIDVVIDIPEPIEEINMDIIDLTRCMGILLDNAIEAAEKTDKQYVMTAIADREEYIIIEVENSCNKDVQTIDKMFEKGFSTKGENRGIGLSNLKEILKEYKENVYVETLIKDNKFKQCLKIIKSIKCEL